MTCSFWAALKRIIWLYERLFGLGCALCCPDLESLSLYSSSCSLALLFFQMWSITPGALPSPVHAACPERTSGALHMELTSSVPSSFPCWWSHPWKFQVRIASPKSSTRFGRGKSCNRALPSAPGGPVQPGSRVKSMAHHGWLGLREESLQSIAARPSWLLIQSCSCDGAWGAKTNLSCPWVCSCTLACTLHSHQWFSLGWYLLALESEKNEQKYYQKQVLWMNQPTRGLPARLHLLAQCLFGQMSIYFSWRQEGVRMDGGIHHFQFAAFLSVCTIFFWMKRDCSVSEKLPCCSPCFAVVHNLGGTKKRSTKEVRKLKLS